MKHTHHFYLRQFVCASKQNICKFMAGSSCSLSASWCSLIQSQSGSYLHQVAAEEDIPSRLGQMRIFTSRTQRRGLVVSFSSPNTAHASANDNSIKTSSFMSSDATKWPSQSSGSRFCSLMGTLACMSARVGRTESWCDSGAS